jgi:hypothetical protein
MGLQPAHRLQPAACISLIEYEAGRKLTVGAFPIRNSGSIEGRSDLGPQIGREGYVPIFLDAIPHRGAVSLLRCSMGSASSWGNV